MSKELYIQVKVENIEIALLEDKKLIEYHSEKKETTLQVGDFYLGKVKKIMPSMNAAFVDIGFDRDGFLHYTDLSPNIYSILHLTKELMKNSDDGLCLERLTLEAPSIKKGRIEDILKSKPFVLVQVMKEPIASKGARLSCEFSLSGRHVVLTPFGTGVNLSKKIHLTDERKRLLSTLNALKVNNFGIVARTAAEGKSVEELQQDMNNMVGVWRGIEQNLRGAQNPMRVRNEDSKINTMLRDLLSDDFVSILTDNASIKNSIAQYLQTNAPEKLPILKEVVAKPSLFEVYHINKQIKNLFGRTVYLGSGASLVIEKSEALHVIDVNSGTKSGSNNQENNALDTNIEAAKEIARQLRLRDLGGIIVIDFIDMKNPENKKQIQDLMTTLMKTDRAKHTILPLSKFNLMQITRQRMKPEVSVDISEECPMCKGTGKVLPLLNIEQEISQNLAYITSSSTERLYIMVHPIIRAFLTKGLISIRLRWMWQYKTYLSIRVDKNATLNQYMILGKNQDEIIKK